MNGGWRYRTAGVVGTAVITATVIVLVNNAVVLSVASVMPVLSQLPPDTPHGPELFWELLTATAAFVVVMMPLYKPRPRRFLDTVAVCQRRVLLGMVALAAIGYFDYTYRLPRLTVLLATPVLLLVLPGWFVWIRRRPDGMPSRAVVIGDDPEQIRTVAEETDQPLLGYLAPSKVFTEGGIKRTAATDGGLERVGGLLRIEEVLVDLDVDTAILAFERANRAEFFGALDACYDHGISAKVHRDHADSVLTSEEALETFVDVDIEPWDIQDYIVKRVFDVIISLVGLIALAPVMVAVAITIKLDDGGTVLYKQKRTTTFGGTFDVYKFRTMVVDAERETGPVLSSGDVGGVDTRVTNIGRILRRTHLDEIPQLWLILKGDMSVVGPRPERPALDDDIQGDVFEWRKRWFVKPGLTGLAQVNGVGSDNPDEKVRYDLEYVRRQSVNLDVKIVIRQIWAVLTGLAPPLRRLDRWL